MSERKMVHVAAALIVTEGRALLTRRAGGRYAGKWELPGGKVEIGESAAQACRREIAEELNLKLGELTDLFCWEYDYPNFHLKMEVFEAKLPDGARPELKVHDAYACAGAAELTGFDWIEADRQMIPKLKQALAAL